MGWDGMGWDGMGWDGMLSLPHGCGQRPEVQLLPLLLICWVSSSKFLHIFLPMLLSCPLGCQLSLVKDPVLTPAQQNDMWRVRENDNSETEDHAGYIVSAVAVTQAFF